MVVNLREIKETSLMDKGARRESLAYGKGNKKLQVKSGAPACGALHGPGHFLQGAD